MDHPERLAKAQYTAEVTSPADGYAQITDCEKLGWACVALGAGRNTKVDAIDPAVGLIFHRKRGAAVRQGEVLCTIHYNSPARLDDARRLIAASFQITRQAPKPQPLVRCVIGAPGASAY